MPGEKICQPGNFPWEKSGGASIKNLLITNKYQIMPTARTSQGTAAGAGKFEIGSFAYILIQLIMGNGIKGCPCH
jgi:hypothetical protein